MQQIWPLCSVTLGISVLGTKDCMPDLLLMGYACIGVLCDGHALASQQQFRQCQVQHESASAHLNSLPSCLRRDWNTTQRAGALTPMAKVSVENSTLMSPLQNSISTTSFMIGSSPAQQTHLRHQGSMVCEPVSGLLCGHTSHTALLSLLRPSPAQILNCWLTLHSVHPTLVDQHGGYDSDMDGSFSWPTAKSCQPRIQQVPLLKPA